MLLQSGMFEDDHDKPLVQAVPDEEMRGHTDTLTCGFAATHHASRLSCHRAYHGMCCTAER